MSTFRRKQRRSFRIKRRRGLKSLSRFRRKRVTLKKRVRKLERMIEKKTRDNLFVTDFANTGIGDVLSLTQIPLGTGDSQRIGDKVTGVSLQVKVNIHNTVINKNQVRIVVVLDKNHNFNAVATFDEIYGTNPTRFLAMRNRDEFPRFVTLKDMLFNLAAVDLRGDTRVIKMFFKTPMQFHFKGTVADDASTGNNMISIYIIVEGGTDEVEYSAASRFRYTDA